ncbi:MAG: hypothetical protein WC628_08750 [Candidatus Omnitrophota bacterium]
MRKNFSCGFIVICVISCFSVAFCAEEPPQDLGKITITKEKSQLFSAYSFKEDTLLSLPIDSPSSCLEVSSDRFAKPFS